MRQKGIFEKELVEIRKKIDKIDNNIINLLNKRGVLAQKIGNLKKIENRDIYQPKREIEVINRMKKKSKVLHLLNIEKIWKEIMDACRIIQEMKE